MTLASGNNQAYAAVCTASSSFPFVLVLVFVLVFSAFDLVVPSVISSVATDDDIDDNGTVDVVNTVV